MPNLTVAQAARYYRVSVATVYTLCQAKKLRAHKLKGRWCVRVASVGRLVASKGVAEIMGYSDRYIRKLASEGRLRASYVGRQCRISAQETAKLLSMRT